MQVHVPVSPAGAGRAEMKQAAVAALQLRRAASLSCGRSFLPSAADKPAVKPSAPARGLVPADPKSESSGRGMDSAVLFPAVLLCPSALCSAVAGVAGVAAAVVLSLHWALNH